MLNKSSRVPAQQCAGKYGDVAGASGQCAQGVPLGRISSLQLVDFICNAIIEEAVHVPADEVDRSKAANLLAIRLPKGAVEWPAGMIGSITLAQHFAELHLLEVHCQQAFALRAEVDRSPAVGIDNAALIAAAAGNLVGVPPEVPKLGPISTHHEQCRRRAN